MKKLAIVSASALAEFVFALTLLGFELLRLEQPLLPQSMFSLKSIPWNSSRFLASASHAEGNAGSGRLKKNKSR